MHKSQVSSSGRAVNESGDRELSGIRKFFTYRHYALAMKSRLPEKQVAFLRNVLRVLYSPFAFIFLLVYYILPWGLRFKFVYFYYSCVVRCGPLRALTTPDYLEYQPTDTTKRFLENKRQGLSSQDIAVHFSGGGDSTLVAALVAPYFCTVHLLTFCHSFIKNPDQSSFNVNNLRGAFGNVKFRHEIIDIDHVMRELYHKKLHARLLKYSSLLVGAPCGYCRMAMHVSTIAYCKKNGIKYATDGATYKHGKLAPAEMIPVMEIIGELYKSYDMTYLINPGYWSTSAETELYELGVVDDQHFRRPGARYRKMQPSCPMAPLFMMAYNCFCGTFRGTDYAQKLAVRRLTDCLPECRNVIGEELAKVQGSA